MLKSRKPFRPIIFYKSRKLTLPNIILHHVMFGRAKRRCLFAVKMWVNLHTKWICLSAFGQKMAVSETPEPPPRQVVCGGCVSEAWSSDGSE